MESFVFEFFAKEKFMERKTIISNNIDEAIKKADRVLLTNKHYDEWELIPAHKKRIGTQRSPFRIGS